MAHTPGPWGFGRTSEDQRIILGNGGVGRYVCNVQIHQTPRKFGLIDEPEREANANLILATTDMLAALKKAEEADEFHANCDECEGTDQAPEACAKCFPLADDARVMRRAAIAKAEPTKEREGA